MDYSAGNNSNLMWFVETRETVRLIQSIGLDEAKLQIIQNDVYQQKAENRRKKQFNCIYGRVSALPVSLQRAITDSDLQTAKLIVLVSIMLTDRLFFELVNEVYREKLLYAEDVMKDADVNVFFRAKADQSDKIASWSEAGIKKLKQTYQKYMLEAGLLAEGGKTGKKVTKPYVDENLRRDLLNNHLEKYLYALTGER